VELQVNGCELVGTNLGTCNDGDKTLGSIARSKDLEQMNNCN